MRDGDPWGRTQPHNEQGMIMSKQARRIGILAVLAAVLVPAASAAASQYVALGDSYSSGVGTRTFYEESGSC
jgi:hypothetical protein